MRIDTSTLRVCNDCGARFHRNRTHSKCCKCEHKRYCKVCGHLVPKNMRRATCKNCGHVSAQVNVLHRLHPGIRPDDVTLEWNIAVYSWRAAMEQPLFQPGTHADDPPPAITAVADDPPEQEPPFAWDDPD